MFGIVIKSARLRAFDESFTLDPKMGPAITQAILRRWVNEGRAPQPWVYPSGAQFIVSDDYYQLKAIKMSGVDQIACQCLGRPRDHCVMKKTTEWPLQWVRDAFGVTD